MYRFGDLRMRWVISSGDGSIPPASVDIATQNDRIFIDRLDVVPADNGTYYRACTPMHSV